MKVENRFTTSTKICWLPCYLQRILNLSWFQQL